MHRTLTCLKPGRVSLRLLGVFLFLACLLPAPHSRADARTDERYVAPDTLVRVEPPERVVDPGGTFTVDVVVENVSDLGGYEFKLLYDASVIELSSAENGDFLGSSGRSIIPIDPTVDNEAGRATLAAASFGDAPGAEGTGVLTTITLMAVGEGLTDLTLQDVKLVDPAAEPMEVTVEGGRVKVGEGPMPTRSPTQEAVETATPTPTERATAVATATPSRAPAEATPLPASRTATPVETEPPSPVPTSTETVASETPTAISPTAEVEGGTATPTANLAEAGTSGGTATVARTAVPTGTSPATPALTAEPTETAVEAVAEASTETPEPVPTDALDGTGVNRAPTSSGTLLLITAVVLAVAGIGMVAGGVLLFGFNTQTT